MSILSVLNSKAKIHDQSESPLFWLPSEKILEIFLKCSFADLLSCRLLCKKVTQILGLYPLRHRLQELKSSKFKGFFNENEVMIEEVELEISLYSLEKIRREKKEEFIDFDVDKYLAILLHLAPIAANTEVKKAFLEEAKEILLSETEKFDSENEGANIQDKEFAHIRDPMKPLNFFKETVLIMIAELEATFDLIEAEKTLKKAEASLDSIQYLYWNHLFERCEESGYALVATLIHASKVRAKYDKAGAEFTIALAKNYGRSMEMSNEWNILKALEFSIKEADFLIVPEKAKNKLLNEKEKEDKPSEEKNFNHELRKADFLFKVDLNEKAEEILNEIKTEAVKTSDAFYLSKIALFEAEVVGNHQLANQTLSDVKKIVNKMEPDPNRDQRIFEIAALEATLDLSNVNNAKAAAKSMKDKKQQLIVTLRVLNAAAKIWKRPSNPLYFNHICKFHVHR